MQFNNLADPANPVSPLSPANPANPLHPIHDDAATSGDIPTWGAWVLATVIASLLIAILGIIYEIARG